MSNPHPEPEPLKKDIDAFNAELPKLLDKSGKYAVFFDGKLLATCDTYSEGLTVGYEAAKLSPFLVQQISAVPEVQHFSRAIGF